MQINIIDILITIGKSHLFILILLMIIFLIERMTKLKLVFDSFKWKKSPLNAKAASTRDAGNYFIINLIVFVYDIYNNYVPFNLINCVIWLIILIILTKVFYRIHIKYQAVDPNKADDDYSD